MDPGFHVGALDFTRGTGISCADPRFHEQAFVTHRTREVQFSLHFFLSLETEIEYLCRFYSNYP